MQITETQLRQIRGCSNILASLQEDKGIDEYVRDMLLSIESNLTRIVDDVANGSNEFLTVAAADELPFP